MILKYIQGLEERSGVLLAGAHQHGFMKNRSTTTACLAIQTKLAEKLEQGKTMLLYSTDLTAAFDMLDPHMLRDRLTNLNLPEQLVNALSDYVMERAAYVDICGNVSEVFDIVLGCVQGSILGPVIFSIFMRPLGELVTDLTSYADDTYGLMELADTNDVITPAKLIEDHLAWLRSTGMIANDRKTEIMILHKTDKIRKKFKINGHEIESLSTIKILGLHFNQNLTWSDHVIKNINNCQRTLHGLKIIRKYFSFDKFVTILTSFLFSKLFYAIEVWSYDLLPFNIKKVLDSFYYKSLRVALNDFNNVISRDEINKLVKRATPQEYSNFSLARTIIKTFTTKNSPLLYFCKKQVTLLKENKIKFFSSILAKTE